jgi:hypothetical protein
MENLIEVNGREKNFGDLIQRQRKNGTFADETFIAYTAQQLEFP